MSPETRRQAEAAWASAPRAAMAEWQAVQPPTAPGAPEPHGAGEAPEMERMLGTSDERRT
ncbi:MAG: hypothetical protein IVW57_14970 [Ktedonobacterales bacterium]|nr:hypothetical protein [Ktedonobacterales bacterium]